MNEKDYCLCNYCHAKSFRECDARLEEVVMREHNVVECDVFEEEEMKNEK